MTYETHTELIKDIEKLKEYAKLDGAEMGEYWGNLCSLAGYIDCMDSEFEKAYKEEIERALETIRLYTEVVEETVEQPPIRIKQLIWK